MNPRQQEVIFRLRCPKRPPGSILPFPQLLQRRGLLASRCLCPSTMVPCSCKWINNRTATYYCSQGTSQHLLVSLWKRREQSLWGRDDFIPTVQTAGDTGEETHLQSEEGRQWLPCVRAASRRLACHRTMNNTFIPLEQRIRILSAYGEKVGGSSRALCERK